MWQGYSAKKSIEKMEGEHVQELITEKELRNIIG